MSAGVRNYANGDVRPICDECYPKWIGLRIPATPTAYGDALQALKDHRLSDHVLPPSWFIRDGGWKSGGKSGQGYRKTT